MGFEVYAPRAGFTSVVKPGTAVLTRNGQARFAAVDLRNRDIGDRCAVLIDKATKRLALRAPRDVDEQFAEPSAVVKWAKGGRTAYVNLGGALKQVGVDPATCAGAYELQIKEKEGLVILNFLPEGAGTGGTKRKAKR